tara:strand:+ start:101 stop:499 length:399 start_codon:yes stop_codon:yes gene_type:complete
MADVNPLYDPATDDAPIAEDVQERLNKPLADQSGFDADDELFLNDVIAKFDEGLIKPFEPSSLLNQTIYENLKPEQQGKADQNAFNILTTLRTIHDQWKANPTPTFQIKNQIHQIRLTKERLEEELGDVYIV